MLTTAEAVFSTNSEIFSGKDEPEIFGTINILKKNIVNVFFIIFIFILFYFFLFYFILFYFILLILLTNRISYIYCRLCINIAVYGYNPTICQRNHMYYFV